MGWGILSGMMFGWKAAARAGELVGVIQRRRGMWDRVKARTPERNPWSHINDPAQLTEAVFGRSIWR